MGPNRHWRNQDGQLFDGYDDKEENKTAWYEHGTDRLDSVTDIPSDEEQNMNDEGYYY